MENNNVKLNQNGRENTVKPGHVVDKVIKFVPDRPIMTLHKNVILSAINANIRGVIPNYEGARLTIKGGAITMQLAFRPSELMVKANIVKTIFDDDNHKAPDTYTLTQEGKNLLSDFVSTGVEIPVETFAKGKKCYVIVTINPAKTLNKILEPAAEGHIYNIVKVQDTTKGQGSISLALDKKRVPKQKQANNYRR